MGNNNTAVGDALTNNTTGNNNTALGFNALLSNATADDNTATGAEALMNNTTGKLNIAVGFEAGSELTTGANNIDIGNSGVASESGTIRIGTKGAQTRAFVASVNSSPIFGVPVLVNVHGRLGIQASSVRYKRDIRNMGSASDSLLKLRPVIFRYKQDPKRTLQYGLIAEEVEQVYPELVTHDDGGSVMGVRYDMLPALLLNEMQKLVRESRRKDAKIAAQQRQLDTLEAREARIDALVGRINAPERRVRLSRSEHLASAMP